MASKKPSKTNLRARDLDAAVRDYISRQGNATFNYRQVSYALGADTAKFQRAIALLLARWLSTATSSRLLPENIRT